LSLGAARPSDFDEHVAALAHIDEAPTLLPPIVARLEAAYREALGDDFAAGWRTGLRDWHEVPGRINVRRILWLDALVRAYDLLEFAQERYASLDPDDHWVPGARAETFDDDEMTAAFPDSPFQREIAERLRRAHVLLSNPGVRPQP
jgi:predicted aldo/keto reductase-like oxidoreductase